MFTFQKFQKNFKKKFEKKFTFHLDLLAWRLTSDNFLSSGVNVTEKSFLSFRIEPVVGSRTRSTSFCLNAVLSASGSVPGSQKLRVEEPNRSFATSFVAKKWLSQFFFFF